MRGNPKINNKTNITLSVENEVINNIKQEAEIGNTSVSAKVNRILNDYVLFGKYFAEKRPVMFTPPIFRYFLDKVDEKIWLDAWTISLSEITPQVFAMHNVDFTLDNVINYMFGDIGMRIGTFDRFTCDSNSIDSRKLVMEHKYGIKWSKILSSAFSNMLEKKFNCRVYSKIFPNALVLDISER